MNSVKFQNVRLRILTGGYKRTSIALLKCEIDIAPLEFYSKTNGHTRSYITRDQEVEKVIIKTTLDLIWRSRATRIRHL